MMNDTIHMKKIILGFLLLGFATAAFAADQADLDNRIRTLTTKFEAYQQRPDGGVPAQTLRNAKGVILLDRTKAGFIFAYQGGGGVALVKDQDTKTWSPVGFYSANQASLGLVAGGEKNFFVILLMTPDSLRMLTDPKYNFGGEVTGTAGSVTGTAQGNLTSTPPVVIYDEKQGLYGGVAIKSGSITPDDKANSIYYGQSVTAKDILFNHVVQPTTSAVNLANQINAASKK